MMEKFLYPILFALTGLGVLLIHRVGDHKDPESKKKKKRIIVTIFFGWLLLVAVIYLIKNVF